jgi:hypothetical protein
LILLSFAMTSLSAQATTCPQALEENHAALLQCLKVVDLKKAEITQFQISLEERDKLLASTQAALRDEQESKNSLLRNPFFLVGIGLVIGVAITK